MSFQISILKILAGQPDGRASLAVLKQYLAVYYSSGTEWTDRMKGLAARATALNIFSQGLVARDPGEWRITDKGRAFLSALEHGPDSSAEQQPPVEQRSDTAPKQKQLPSGRRARQGRRYGKSRKLRSRPR